jgi:2-polyprenyl-6-methoxyphenol hydroxylase-like FAD-dependent oxidoreductase
MFRKQETEVLVVGAGPVGMFAALSLAERGVAVTLIDESWRATARSYALALHPHSLELLDGAGLMDELTDQGHRIDTVAVYEGGERRVEIPLAELPGGFPFLLVLPQDRLERALARRLQDKGVAVRWNRRLAGCEQRGRDGDPCVVSQVEELAKESVGYGVATSEWVVEERGRVVSSFVIGADGHRSSVRRLLGIDFEKVAAADAPAEEVYAVFEVESEPPAPHEVRVVLADGTSNVLWPLGPERLRWSFQLADPEGLVAQRSKGRLAVQLGGDVFPYLDRDDLGRLVAERAPWSGDGPGRGELDWSVAVRFERRLASRFGDGRVWLAGDAAHLAGPVGVQSMNVGLREAHELAWRMAEVLHAGGSEELLAAYERERRAEWRRLLGLEGAPAVADGAAPWVARNAGRLLSCLPASGDDLALLARRVGLELAVPAS